jgi:hypothetical protein
MAELLPEVVASFGLGVWLLAALELVAWYLKALGLAGAEIGELGLAIAELGEIPRTLALLLALTAALAIASERIVRGESVFHRLFPLLLAALALLPTAIAAAIHLALYGQADPDRLRLYSGLTWPPLILTAGAIQTAVAICALLARGAGGRPWAAVLFALPLAAALGFYLLVTRTIADYGVNPGANALPAIFPRPWSLALGLAVPIATFFGLERLARAAESGRPRRTALTAAAAWSLALHAVVCLGTVAPLMPLAGFAVDERVRQVNEWASWILAAGFAALWIALYAIQSRRYRTRRPERS